MSSLAVVLGVAGLGFLAVAALLLAAGDGRRRLLTSLSACTGAALVACPLLALAAPGAPGASVRAGALGALLLLPVLLVLVPTGRPGGWPGWLALSTAVGTGALAVALPDPFVHTGSAGLVQVLVVVVALWTRSETARGPGAETERAAVLWLALSGGGTLLVVGHLTFLASPLVGAAASAVVVPAVPAGVAVAVLRPAAADVRGLIARAVVEATALVAVVALFVALAGGLQLLTGRRPGIGTTALVAAACALALHPVRVVLRGTVQRLLFGDREDVVTAASRVGAGLADDPVVALRALREALGLPWATLHAGEGDDVREVARSGTPDDPAHRVPLRAGTSAVGRLDVGLAPGRPRLTPEDRRVLDVVAPALAQALRARALTEQLRDSRASVITAVEDERRRLRHDLHDGLGPTLTGIAFTADAAGNVLPGDPARAAALVASVRAEASGAIGEVRRIVEGLRPPALDELGLEGALRQQAARLRAADGAPVSVRLEVRLDPRTPDLPLPAAVEVAAYRIAVEALTNVARHAGAGSADVRLVRSGHRLELAVRDDGASDATWVPGVGLTSMRDRAEQLGGTFSASSGPTGGVVRVSLPV